MDTKAEILYRLMAADGAVSGQRLAKELNITRSAVWKAVTALKSDGYGIDGGTNKGYMLNNDADLLNAEIIRKLKKSAGNVYVYDEVVSTNSEAKQLAAAGAPEGTVIIADSQTGGKGRRGRDFFSPKGTGLYMSVVMRPDIRADESILVTTAAALAAAKAIRRITDKDAVIKWINDIYLEGKKIAGILTEAVFGFESGEPDCVIVGIGINVGTSKFPDEIKNKAGSLGGGINRNELAAAVSDGIVSVVKALPDKKYLSDYKKLLFILGKKVEVVDRTGKSYAATALDIDGNGALIVKKGDGSTAVLNNEEVSLKLAGDIL